ncbi:AcrR family transcriptional regulator [Microbacterium resistens]|uniref:AcrR family transcriptional regulator n=1 Tax=Microbacterium resistens TaxID=156977 RepID=A0ABU1S815_9MICO|nr:AcrR family transcriptional regulator [Microbacterium resistens]
MTATTPRQVWERSGTGQGSLYHHFPTKHDFVLEAISLTAEQLLERSRASLGRDVEPDERLRGYLTRPRDAVAGCRIGRLVSDQSVMTDEGLRQPVRDYFLRLLELVAGAFEQAGHSPDVSRRRAMTAVAVIQGGYVLSRALGDAEPMRLATEELMELLEATLAPRSETAAS